VSSQRSQPKTHFELFGLEPVFDLPQAELDDRFRRYQAAVHPDRHAGGSDTQRRLALQFAANGNEAYRILSDATSRGAYLCELHGAPIDAERNTAMPADFLMQQMAWREAIDEVRGLDGDVAASGLGARLGAERDLTLARLKDLIDGERDFPQAAMQVRRLMFYDKLQSELRQVLRRQR
jgi:molecular chaperone HscB